MTTQSFAYEKKGNSAVIWRCFSYDTMADVPEEIEGLKVTGIAPYTFSAHMDAKAFQKALQDGTISIYVPDTLQMDSLPPALCGTAVTEVRFPDSVTQVGRYCFYNCANLQKLSFSGMLGDWGSGVFTGCHKVRNLTVSIDRSGVSFLKSILDELPEELRVEYVVEPVYNAEGELCSDQGHAHLVFPEFFEEGTENTPAKILGVRYHGMGMRYRNCFKNKIFDFRKFDDKALFQLSITQEPAETMAEMAMNRLRYPYELSEQAAEMYREHIQMHGHDLIGLLMKQKDLAGIRWLLDIAGKDQRLIEELTEQASKHQFAEALSCLMEYHHTNTKTVRRRREL